MNPTSSNILRLARWASLPAALVVAGCAAPPAGPADPAGTRYQCDNGIEVRVKGQESATLQTGRGTQVLLRDAGGVGPRQMVFSTAEVRFSTGLDPDARGALLEGLVPHGRARCLLGK